MLKKLSISLTIVVFCSLGSLAASEDTSRATKSLADLISPSLDTPSPPDATTSITSDATHDATSAPESPKVDVFDWRDARRAKNKEIQARRVAYSRARAEYARQLSIRASRGTPGFYRTCPGGKCGGR